MGEVQQVHREKGQQEKISYLITSSKHFLYASPLGGFGWILGWRGIGMEGKAWIWMQIIVGYENS